MRRAAAWTVARRLRPGPACASSATVTAARALGPMPESRAAPLSTTAGGGSPDPRVQRQQEKFREALRSLGATAGPGLGGAGGRGQPQPEPRAAPPLSPEQLLAAAMMKDGEAIAKDPALGGSVEALLFLADIFWTGLVLSEEKGLVVAQDHAKSAQLWRVAGHERGDAGARYNYANCLLHGHGVPENRQQAEHILVQLVEEGGNPQASYSLAVLLSARLQQQGRPQQRQQAARRGTGRKGAEEGEQDADGALAERVYQLLTAAVKGGVLPAIHNLANVLAEGSPRVPRDDEAALELYTVGAELGDPWSTLTAATWLCQGRGGEEDWEKGFRLHLQAAGYGMPQAAYNVATHYFTGRGVEQDMPQAAEWFRRAAEAGLPQSMVNLGNMYLERLVPPPPPPPPPAPAGGEDAPSSPATARAASLAEARRWYEKAAAAGSEEGRQSLLRCAAIEKEEKERSAASDGDADDVVVVGNKGKGGAK